MDWVSTIVGALIGFICSIGIILIQRALDKAGKLNIYTKIVYDHSTGSYTWGFQDKGDHICLNVPLWIEVHNLSNSTRIMRDVNLVLAKDGKVIVPMTQSNRSTSKKTHEEYLYANRGSYSFSIAGNEIVRYECHFLLKDALCKAQFYEIKLRYYDEKNRCHHFSLGSVRGDWVPREFSRVADWKLLKEEK